MASWGFEPGREYNRRADIHARFDGQRQGGIITPKKHNVIFIISGKRGREYGYNDRHHADGLVEYFGEGQKGDMTLTAGNLRIAEHAERGKSLLYFEKQYPSRHIIFRNELVCEGYHWEDSIDVEGNTRKAIVFELWPLDRVIETVDEIVATKQVSSIDLLRARAFAAAAPSQAKSVSTRTVFQRSADVRDYVLVRSNGMCEGCGTPAPFARKDGAPYLEPHHIRRVSDGGLDDPRFVIALCPNCHTRVHRGLDGDDYNDRLRISMKGIETH